MKKLRRLGWETTVVGAEEVLVVRDEVGILDASPFDDVDSAELIVSFPCAESRRGGWSWGIGALGAGNPLGSAELADGAFASTSRLALLTQRTNLMNGFTGSRLALLTQRTNLMNGFTGTGALGVGGVGGETGNVGALGADGRGALVKTCVGAPGG